MYAVKFLMLVFAVVLIINKAFANLPNIYQAIKAIAFIKSSYSATRKSVCVIERFFSILPLWGVSQNLL